MTLIQIIILTILIILLVWSNHLVAKELNHGKSSVISFISSLMLQAMFVLFTIMGIIEMNQARDTIKGKCPEYEKIENVYKLK